MKLNPILGYNDLILPVDLGANANPPGVICAANEARFTSTYFSEPLTAYTVGWQDPENLEAILDELFPSIEVPRRFEWKKSENAQEFLSETDDIRAIGSPFKRVETAGTSVTDKTVNKGLTQRVDHDEVVGADWKERTVQRLLQRLRRNDLRRGVALVDTAATNAAKTWGSTSNPDGDMRAALKLGADATGIRPTRVVFGEAAWDLRADAYEVQNTPYAGRAAGMTPEELGRKLMVDRVAIIKARYQSSASAKTAVVPSVVYAYLAEQGAQKDDPSNVKRFYTPTDAGRYKVYVQEYEKFTDISVEHYSNLIITGTTGIRKITASA
ncbi:MAG: hypothetical protein ACYDC1_24790 [Limisphaerales bacterium]